MPKAVKLIVVCVLCVGIITGIVYLIRWLF
jgi:phage shock protein PspC (stress-responsive transcriptional regulator)